VWDQEARKMPTYTCLCCEHTQTFATAEAAHAASWDVAPYFTLQPLCDWCMSWPILIHGLDEARRLHAEEHESWKKNGRPLPIHESSSEEPQEARD
jgi:hypothetical protein